MIRETAIKHFGFFPDRPSREDEYRYILDDAGDSGRACDIGAGLSPVPIILAERGWTVDTVDIWREDTGNEWGFFNYNNVSKNITSYNQDFAGFDGGPYDLIYSVSAIEHMPRATREKVINRVFSLLQPGGAFLATVDIRQRTNEIHNRSYGKPIEDNHGTIADLIHELEIFETVLWWVEEFDGQGQDVLFINAIK